MITAKKFVEDSFKLIEQETSYRNVYPYNCLYYNGSGKGGFSGDCNNYIKSLINGRDINNKTIGSYQRTFSVVADVTVLALFNGCTKISTDFTSLGDSIKFLLYDSKGSHIGVYIGGEFTKNNKVYNVIECTANSVIGSGIKPSYVDNTGKRYNYKGGTRTGQWIKHGVPSKYLNMNTLYTFETASNNSTKSLTDNEIISIAKEVIAGKWGNGVARKTKLTSAGYDYSTIQSCVDRLVNKAGAAIKLTNEPLYISSEKTTASNKITGTYYYWDDTPINNRRRITNNKDNVGKANQVTGYIDVC